MAETCIHPLLFGVQNNFSLSFTQHKMDAKDSSSSQEEEVAAESAESEPTISPPPKACPLPILVAWVDKYRPDRKTLAAHNRAIFNTIDRRLRNRSDYAKNKDNPLFMLRKGELAAVSIVHLKIT